MSNVLYEQRLRTGGLRAVLGLVTVIVIGAMVSVGRSGTHSSLAALVEIFVPLLLLSSVAMVWRIDVRVVTDQGGPGLAIAYGFGLIRQRFLSSDIVSVQAKNLSFVEMGGWGYRGSLKVLKYAALATRRGEALELTLSGNRRFVVTVDGPEHFVDALRK